MLRSYHIKGQLEAGCDEAGRGCLAGPVFAAAVILPKDFRSASLDDSKKMKKELREKLRQQIEEQAIAWAVASCDHREIDRLNILWASVRAMHKALNKLKMIPDLILVDGNKFRQYRKIEHICVVKGDGIYNSIAAASVLAKTHRDEYMTKAHRKYPQYGWNKNMAYPTSEHKIAIKKVGISPIHRRTFKCEGTPLKDL